MKNCPERIHAEYPLNALFNPRFDAPIQISVPGWESGTAW